MVNFRYLFEDSFHKVCLDEKKSAEFFSQFYINFIDNHPQVKEKFVDTDMQMQRDMLKMSFIYLIDFFQTFEETARMQELARVHSKMARNITADMYDKWLDALLDTLEQVLPESNDDIKLAWRIMLAPGIEYMKRR